MVDTWPACHACLQTECATELAACDAECVAIQACLDTVCQGLSAAGNAVEEGKCQVACQAKHFGSKQKHIDVVNCAQQSLLNCAPPCAAAPYDWEQCVDHAAENQCKDAQTACTSDDACTDYIVCVTVCNTAAECVACSDTPAKAAGRALYEAYWACVEDDCLTEYWLPQF